MPVARERAQRALRAMGIDVAAPRRAVHRVDPTFADAVGFLPNAMQRRMGDLPLAPDPEREGQVVVLESETGSGKTEAALWHFLRLFRAGLVDGLYFALPTRAAATQIHARVSRVIRRLFPGDQAPPVVLAVPGYVRVDDQDARLLPEFKVLWNDDPGAAERHRRWAAENPKRYMAAPIVVGTVDQALLSNLRVPHAHLRSSSLMRHLLVVDEVHASDPYLQALLRSVLAIHRAAGGYALLMSATLGGCARRRLLTDGRAPMPDLDEALAVPYPVIVSWTDVAERPLAVESLGRDKAVQVTLADRMADPEAVAGLAVEAASRGAKALVIRNTVAAAVATQQALEGAIGPHSPLLFRCADTATLHHARFAREDRGLLDAAIEAQMGRERPRGGIIVVGTQTLEQSLDIDADVLVTDLCPMDVLLQRIGRLHRHRRDDRAADYATPRCIVLTPASRDLVPLIRRPANGLGSVYPDLRVIEATWRQLEEHPVLRIPAMNRSLVEHTTHPQCLRALTEGLGGAWPAHGMKIDGIALGQAGLARLNTIPREVPFGEPEMAFADIDEAIRTRLGADDRLVEWGHSVRGPFGAPIRSITVPAHLCGDVPPDADPEPPESRDGGLEFRWGDRRFRYDRLGLRREGIR
jgi:CRISPR-associated endonuclease/helicase Cas3